MNPIFTPEQATLLRKIIWEWANMPQLGSGKDLEFWNKEREFFGAQLTQIDKIVVDDQRKYTGPPNLDGPNLVAIDRYDGLYQA